MDTDLMRMNDLLLEALGATDGISTEKSLWLMREHREVYDAITGMRSAVIRAGCCIKATDLREPASPTR